MIEKALFAKPPAEYRPMPLWVWNDELTPRRVREQLRILRRMGMGGAFVHPRPGLISEYLGPDWWKCWGAALAEAKKLGLKLQIYDENSYPSGFAGGHVPSQLPHAVATGVGMRKLKRGEKLPEISPTKSYNAFAATEWQDQKYVFEGTKGETTQWLGGFAYVNLLRRETTDQFLEVTHAEYFKRFGKEFGRTITAAFYDEPMIGNGGVYGGPSTVAFSRWFADEFRRRRGYDLIPEIPKLFLDLPGYQKARFDYNEVCHKLWVENWARPMQAWCGKHRVAVTGHYMEHTWLLPYAAGTPNAMAMYEWMDMPGIDMLECRIGRPEVTHSIGQTTKLLLLTIRELLSAANQIGRQRTLCETYGAGGYDSTFEDYKRMGDWLLVHGVNYHNPHLSFLTVRGARKRDHPQSFSEHSAWWTQFRALGDYLGRMSYVLSQGRMRQRVLLLHPTTSGWVEANPRRTSEKLNRLREAHSDLVQFLCDRWWDFDLGDEFILENRGKVEHKKLHVGQQSYEVVVVPAHILNLRSATVELLEKFTRRGGRVFILGAAPKLINGMPSNRVEKLARPWTRVPSNEKLDRLLDQTIGRQVQLEIAGGVHRTPTGNVHVMRRELNAKTVCYFFTNMSGQLVRLKARVQERGAIERWDALTGEIQSLAGDGTLDLGLANCDSALYVVQVRSRAQPFRVDASAESGRATQKGLGGRKSASAQIHDRAEALDFKRAQPLELVSIRPHDPNVLVLDYCDLKFGNKTLRGVHQWAAGMEIARAHGFERPVWDNAVQFKRTVLDQDRFVDGSGFAADFQFQIATKPKRLELALECPELYKVSLNGRPVSFRGAKGWLDPHIQSADVTPLVKHGTNAVQIDARPYRLRMELEPVYLRGDFGLEPTQRGFRIMAAEPLRLGSWCKQGRPFYSGAVSYQFRCKLDSIGSGYVLRLPDWSGAVVSVSVNGSEAGLIGWPRAITPQGGYELDVTPWLKRVGNRLRLTVFGTLKNLLGPFHCNSKTGAGWGWKMELPPRRTAWPAMWFLSPHEGPPPGVHYDQIDYGLFATPEIVTLTPSPAH